MKNRSTIQLYGLLILTCLCTSINSSIARADQNSPSYVLLPLLSAQKAATAALNKCEGEGYHISVSVVDHSGNLKVLLRGDGAGPHTQDSSFKKAYTSASIRRSTNELAALITKIPTLQALRDMNDNILILGGGLPIKMGGTVVGGIGVGGAPGADLDEACAQAGLDILQNETKKTMLQ